MPPQVHGIKTQSIPQWEETGTVDRYGVDMITRVELIPKDRYPALLRSKYSIHPRFTSMAVSKVTWTAEKGGQFYRVVYQYEGFLLSLPEPEYELDESLSEEPIQTHPEFEDFAGTPSAPLNNSVFIDPETGRITDSDDKGVWREFGKGEKAGIESYLSPGATWTEIYFSTSRPTDLGQVGTKDSPSGPNPSFAGRNWLFSAVTYKRRGFIYEIRKTWKLSGRNGWDDDIY